ncbi:MAG: SOS response-associated peptidase [Phycisphaerales bacterium]|nr:SOS response-associated peptidase [Phycisphaerales bacterium]
MCGRFAQVFQIDDLEHIERVVNQARSIDQNMLDLLTDNYRPSYNIAPTQYATILHQPSQGRIGATQAHFGLISSWAKDRSRSSSMINARAETITAKPAYRDIYRSRRCLLPITGFYEWQKLTSKIKQPWYIHRADESPMFLAGVCDTWLDPEHGHCEVDSFSLITTQANDFMSDIHHRMPVVVEPESISTWFDTISEPRELARLLVPASDGILSGHCVSSRVNSPANNDSSLIEPDTQSPPASLWG